MIPTPRTVSTPRGRGRLASRGAGPWALVLLACVLWPNAAWAATEAPATWLGLPTWVWAWGNLLVFWGGLFYFVGPTVRSYFERRRQGIQADLQNAAHQRAEAEEMRAGLESKIRELAAEMDRLAERSEEEGKKEREQVLEQAKHEGEKILAQARDEVENRVAQSRAELIQLTAQLAGELARDRVESRLTPESRRQIFERNVARLSAARTEKAS